MPNGCMQHKIVRFGICADGEATSSEGVWQTCSETADRTVRPPIPDLTSTRSFYRLYSTGLQVTTPPKHASNNASRACSTPCKIVHLCSAANALKLDSETWIVCGAAPIPDLYNTTKFIRTSESREASPIPSCCSALHGVASQSLQQSNSAGYMMPAQIMHATACSKSSLTAMLQQPTCIQLTQVIQSCLYCVNCQVTTGILTHASDKMRCFFLSCNAAYETT
jgi:hypothetical protein